MVYFTPKHFCYLKLAMHFMRSKRLTNKQKIFSENQKGFRDGHSYSTPQESKELGEMPFYSLGPLPSLNSTFLMGWD